MNALSLRIDKTLEGYEAVAEDLEKEGYERAARFIRAHSQLMVTFARVALEGKIIPYTSNAIENLMGEIMRRCKHIRA
ncbi:MAG: transposase, partial [Nitrososphaeria archaeon]